MAAMYSEIFAEEAGAETDGLALVLRREADL
jgi:hypothetical protein